MRSDFVKGSNLVQAASMLGRGFTDSLKNVTAAGNQMSNTALSRKELDMKNQKLAAEDERLEAAAKQRKIVNDRAAKNQLYTDKSRNAKLIGNEWLASRDPENRKWLEQDYDKVAKSTFNKVRMGLADEEASYRKYLKSGDPDALEAAGRVFSKSFGTREDTATKNRSEQLRKDNLGALRLELETITDPDKKKDFIDRVVKESTATRRSDLAEEISSGRSLVKKQKLKALLRYMPEEVKEFGDYAVMKTALNSTLYGNTEQSLLAKEAREVKAYNAASKNRYDKDVAKYIGSVKSKGKDYKGLIKILHEDYGWGDNEDKKDIINVMLGEGIAPGSIEFAVAQLKSENFLGKSLPSVDSKAAEKVMSYARDEQVKRNKRNGMSYDKEGNLIGAVAPKKYKVRKERNLQDIQRGLMGGENRNIRTVLQVNEDWKNKYLSRVAENSNNVQENKKPSNTPPDLLIRPEVRPNQVVPVGLRLNKEQEKGFKLNKAQQLGVDTLDAVGGGMSNILDYASKPFKYLSDRNKVLREYSKTNVLGTKKRSDNNHIPIKGGSQKGFKDFLEDMESVTGTKEREAIQKNYRNGMYEPVKESIPNNFSKVDKRLLEVLKRNVV